MEKAYTYPDERKIQIDVKKITETVVVCNLYTGIFTPEIILKRTDFDYLVAKGFFKKASDKQEKDSAGIYYTTEVFQLPVATVIE